MIFKLIISRIKLSIFVEMILQDNGEVIGERCPWDDESDEEDEDWMYDSVSRYQHLLMCRYHQMPFLNQNRPRHTNEGLREGSLN